MYQTIVLGKQRRGFYKDTDLDFDDFEVKSRLLLPWQEQDPRAVLSATTQLSGMGLSQDLSFLPSL